MSVRRKYTAGADGRSAWSLVHLLHRANIEIEMQAGIEGAALDTRSWLKSHLRLIPKEFAFEDWSAYQPAMRKVRLLPLGRNYEEREAEC